jgi:threonine dehydrogenase-like Zn-dependent dehydrogenase
MYALYLSGDAIRLIEDYPRPDPLPGEALIRVLRAGICNTDLELQQGYKGGFEGIPGHEFVGQVEVCESQPDLVGQRVVGEINISCGSCERCRQGMRTHCERRRVLGIFGKDGAFAEYLTLPVENLHLVPDSIADAEAAFVEPLAACFEILEQVQIRPTSAVLVLGDGKLGLLAAQVLRLAGAQVTIEGRHQEKLAIASSLGIETASADDTSDSAASYDVVVECTGSASGLEMARQLVRPRGTIVLKSTVAHRTTLDLAPFVVDEITVVGSRCGPFEPALRALAQKRISVAPLLSAAYPLHQGAEAFARAAEHGMLKVQLEIAHNGVTPP